MLSKFNYLRPKSLDEAIHYMEANPGTKLFAGGTDLMILMRRNMISVEHLLDIKDIPETQRFEFVEGLGFFIGASVTINEISENEIIAKKYNAIKQAADSLASYQLRNRATLVGNICNASPGADMASPLMVYDAIVKIAGPNGEREVGFEQFYIGFKKLDLEPGEIVLGIVLPDHDPEDSSVFLKQARVKGHDLGIAGVSVRYTKDKKVYVAMTAVAPTPVRLRALEAMLETKPFTSETAEWLGEEIKNHIKPISDIRSSAEYRLHVSGVLASRGMNQLIEMGGN
ncbi:MAG TPA: xanthine dehydrogenase family protein subunit M [Clostridiales bacterium UBA8960]|jgi:carbon-monoxide dehydrogenase medium subunit|nr:xanthine dehydrogenase family protein subunit M [Clostridiales bacterium UBA8960]